MASAVRVSHATVATRRRDLLESRAHDVMNIYGRGRLELYNYKT